MRKNPMFFSFLFTTLLIVTQVPAQAAPTPKSPTEIRKLNTLGLPIEHPTNVEWPFVDPSFQLAKPIYTEKEEKNTAASFVFESESFESIDELQKKLQEFIETLEAELKSSESARIGQLTDDVSVDKSETPDEKNKDIFTLTILASFFAGYVEKSAKISSKTIIEDTDDDGKKSFQFKLTVSYRLKIEKPMSKFKYDIKKAQFISDKQQDLKPSMYGLITKFEGKPEGVLAKEIIQINVALYKIALTDNYQALKSELPQALGEQYNELLSLDKKTIDATDSIVLIFDSIDALVGYEILTNEEAKALLKNLRAQWTKMVEVKADLTSISLTTAEQSLVSKSKLAELKDHFVEIWNKYQK